MENLGLCEYEGEKFYKIRVDPKKKTSRHFKGTLYFSSDSLKLKYKIGTLGRCRFPLKYLKIWHKLQTIDDVPVTKLNNTEMRIFVPIIYPDRIIKSKVTVSGIKLIKK